MLLFMNAPPTSYCFSFEVNLLMKSFVKLQIFSLHCLTFYFLFCVELFRKVQTLIIWHLSRGKLHHVFFTRCSYFTIQLIRFQCHAFQSGNKGMSIWIERAKQKKEKKNCVSLLTNYSHISFRPCQHTQGQWTVTGLNQFYILAVWTLYLRAVFEIL